MNPGMSSSPADLVGFSRLMALIMSKSEAVAKGNESKNGWIAYIYIYIYTYNNNNNNNNNNNYDNNNNDNNNNFTYKCISEHKFHYIFKQTLKFVRHNFH
jgi:hypothetical protein